MNRNSHSASRLCIYDNPLLRLRLQWNRKVIGVGRQEAIGKRCFQESSVVALVELVELFLHLGRGHSVKGTKQKALEVREGGMLLRQPLVHHFGTCGARLDLQPLLDLHHACCFATRSIKSYTFMTHALWALV